MGIRFHCKDLLNRERGLTFDDVLIVPSKSEIRSRRIPLLETQLTKKKRIQIPIVSANMDTITEGDMAIALGQLGGVGVIHRFITIEDQVREVSRTRAAIGGAILSASIGVNQDYKERATALVSAGVNVLPIAGASGASVPPPRPAPAPVAAARR